jgi:hypothetical protein
MYTFAGPYLEKGTSKTDFLTFEWEKEQVAKLAIERAKTLAEDIQKVTDFWERQDNAKLNN